MDLVIWMMPNTGCSIGRGYCRQRVVESGCIPSSTPGLTRSWLRGRDSGTNRCLAEHSVRPLSYWIPPYLFDSTRGLFTPGGPASTMHFSSTLFTALMAALATAHPGHDHAKELNSRLEFLANNKNDLSHCAEKMRARGLDASNARRRTQLAESLLKKRGLEGEGFPDLDQ